MKKIFQAVLKFSILGIFFGLTIIGGLLILHTFLIPMIQAEKDMPLNLGGKPKKIYIPASKIVNLKMQNTTFMLAPKIAFDIKELRSKIYPKKGCSLVNFDDVNSFSIDIYYGKLSLKSSVLQAVFNDIVFNYKGATLRNLKIKFVEVERNGKMLPRIRLTGEMKLLIWVKFIMIGNIRIDKKINLMVMEAESVNVMGNPYTLSLMKFVSLKMSSMIKIPDGRGVQMTGNNIFISPFKIFPPPELAGALAGVSIDAKSDSMLIEFNRPEKIFFPPPKIKTKSYLMLKNGVVKFGKLVMYDADLLMIDADPKDTFIFYLKKYFIPLTRGKSLIKGDGSVVAVMPDYDDAAW